MYISPAPFPNLSKNNPHNSNNSSNNNKLHLYKSKSNPKAKLKAKLNRTMEAVEVPSYFLCPISLEIMKDPVTVSTGITYDRSSIEKWLFSENNGTCPVTKQLISVSGDVILTPNHVLRRLIQAWCTLHASNGIERFPTPKPPVSKQQLAKLLSTSVKSPASLPACLRTLRALAAESDANKRCMEASGVVEFLASVVITASHFDSIPAAEEEGHLHFDDDYSPTCSARDDAVAILYHLKISEASLKGLLQQTNGQDCFLRSLIHVMQGGCYDAKVYSLLLFKSLAELADPVELTGLRPEFFVEFIQILRDQISQQASKAVLQLLTSLCPWGRNRVKAVEAGAVPVLIDFLLEHSAVEKRGCEMALMVLDQLCGCAEGRAELLRHAAGLAVVSKKVLRVSPAASERAVRVLLAVARFSASPRVVQEMLEVGVVAKLCLVMQVACGKSTKEKASEILKLHGRAWKNSTCIPSTLISSYPS